MEGQPAARTGWAAGRRARGLPVLGHRRGHHLRVGRLPRALASLGGLRREPRGELGGLAPPVASACGLGCASVHSFLYLLASVQGVLPHAPPWVPLACRLGLRRRRAMILLAPLRRRAASSSSSAPRYPPLLRWLFLYCSRRSPLPLPPLPLSPLPFPPQPLSPLLPPPLLPLLPASVSAAAADVVSVSASASAAASAPARWPAGVLFGVRPRPPFVVLEVNRVGPPGVPACRVRVPSFSTSPGPRRVRWVWPSSPLRSCRPAPARSGSLRGGPSADLPPLPGRTQSGAHPLQ